MHDLKCFEWSQVSKIITLYIMEFLYLLLCNWKTLIWKYYLWVHYWLVLSIIKICTSYFSSYAALFWWFDLGNAPKLFSQILCKAVFHIKDRPWAKFQLLYLWGGLGHIIESFVWGLIPRWAQTPQCCVSWPIKNEYLTLVKQPTEPLNFNTYGEELRFVSS